MADKWLEESLVTIDSQAKDLHPKDYSFYQVDRWKRICERTAEFAPSCQQCTDNKKLISETTAQLNQLIHGKANQRRYLEKQQEQLLKHLRIEHKIYPINYFVSRYSFLFLLAGTAIALLLGLFFSEYLNAFLIAGFSIGLVVGYITGTKKDMDARLRKRLI